jgi:hypothetical protein
MKSIQYSKITRSFVLGISFCLYRLVKGFQSVDYVNNEIPAVLNLKPRTIINSPGLIKSGQNISDLMEPITAGAE